MPAVRYLMLPRVHFYRHHPTPSLPQGRVRREELHIPGQPVDSLGITNGVGVLQHSVTEATGWAPHDL